MARPLRIEFRGAIYHVTAHGNARAAIYHDDADRGLFLDTLGEVVTRFGWLCHAYCLMNNHANGIARAAQQCVKAVEKAQAGPGSDQHNPLMSFDKRIK